MLESGSFAPALKRKKGGVKPPLHEPAQDYDLG
jgi:hypothetical protein